MLELLFECLDAAEVLLQPGGESGAHGTCRGAELLEIHGVVEHLAGVVEQAAFAAAHHLLQRETFEAAAGQELVEVVHVGLEVLAVVEREGLLADDVAQGLVGQGGHGELAIGGHNVFHNCLYFLLLILAAKIRKICNMVKNILSFRK